ncbi:EamA family transporter [Dactylosporangium sp. NPDC005572]|uniref:EamA family transporter n=1 Tax=Dactylosporangium sp. NPDC005572 TaxID=3156889 RepID=UPI0033A9685D
MLSALTLAALAALGWGSSEFLAGLWSRRLSVLVVLGWSKVTGLLLAGVLVVAHGTALPRDGRLWWAVLAGLCSTPALGLLYLAMRKGSLAVVAPVAAVAALVPLVWGAIRGERLSVDDAVGIVAVLAGVTLVSWPTGTTRAGASKNGVAMLYAMGAALGFGAFLVLVHHSSAVDPVWSIALARTSSGVLGIGMLIAAVARDLHRDPFWTGAGVRARRQPVSVAAVVGVVAIGLTDTAGDAAFAFASTIGELSSVAVLSSLYPAVTVLFGAWILGERLTGPRAWGVLAALAGGAFLAAS